MTNPSPALTSPLVPSHFNGIGYVAPDEHAPLEVIRLPVPVPGSREVLVHVFSSSLNPLEYKLPKLNFMGATLPVVLGFDLAGVVVKVGADVTAFRPGDEVMAQANLDERGAWAIGGMGGYALASEHLTVLKPPGLPFADAGVLPMAFTAAFLGTYAHIRRGDTVFIPGGGGGVGHLAIQIAARVLGAAKVISSGSQTQSIELALQSGATDVFDYRKNDTVATVLALTDGRGVDVVFDATYSETGFESSARTVRAGGKWIVLGQGPGKTTRRTETKSAVDDILAARDAQHINENSLRYFSDPAFDTDAARDHLSLAMRMAVEWYTEGKVRPVIAKSISASPLEINRELAQMEAGHTLPGKVAVVLAREG